MSACLFCILLQPTLSLFLTYGDGVGVEGGGKGLVSKGQDSPNLINSRFLYVWQPQWGREIGKGLRLQYVVGGKYSPIKKGFPIKCPHDNMTSRRNLRDHLQKQQTCLRLQISGRERPDSRMTHSALMKLSYTGLEPVSVMRPALLLHLRQQGIGADTVCGSI